MCNAGNKVATHPLNSMPYKIKHIIVVSSIDCKTLNAFLCLYGKLWIDQTMLTDYLYSFSYFIVYHLPYDPYDTLSECYFVFYFFFFPSEEPLFHRLHFYEMCFSASKNHYIKNFFGAVDMNTIDWTNDKQINEIKNQLH